MSDDPKVTRHEILEERANRDAFRLAVMFFVVLLALIAVMGVAAWRLSLVLMPIVPRELPRSLSTPRAESTAPIKTANRSATARGVDRLCLLAAPLVRVEQTCGPARASVGGVRAAGPQQFSARA